MKGILTRLTEGGRISLPASLRKLLHLKRGQVLLWERVSNDECRVRIVRHHETGATKSMRGFMKCFQADSSLPATTAGWMKVLREGERN
jgi:bifunctional DNA-binding transcriptional regulator/antitoxin component of YhaV-PrlF toxin-antitoxin module